MAYENTTTTALGALLVAILPVNAWAKVSEPLEVTSYEVAIGVIVIQFVILAFVLLSRKRYKSSGISLQKSRKDLEKRVTERTEKLRRLNNQLYNEIAKHKSTEELLRNTQVYLNSIINSMPSIIIGVTREGLVTHWNTAATNATDISSRDVLGKHLFEVYPDLPLTMKMILETIDTGLAQTQENIQQSTGRERIHLDLTIYPLLTSELTGAVIRLDDVTLRVRMESMMIQNEKMMSLGELAAGMAHEINNPLSAIVNSIQNIYRRTSNELPKNLEIARKHDTTIEQVHDYLEEREIFKFLEGMRKAGDISARIVSNMLTFSRSNSADHTATDITQLMEQSLELANNSFELRTPDGLEQLIIHKEFQDKLPNIFCSPSEIQQVILNLLRNACQAYRNEEYGAPLHPTLMLRVYEQHGMLKIDVEDNGVGMPEDVRRHIFEPFFTTKEVGQGTGSGLSVSYFIVTEHHDGTIEVQSQPGEGTKFTISLPITESNSADAL